MVFELTHDDGLVHCSVKKAAVLYENHRERVKKMDTPPVNELAAYPGTETMLSYSLCDRY